MARVTRQGQKVSLGVFKTAVDAAVAYAKHMREPPSVPAAPPTSGQAPAPPAGAATLGSSPSAARAVAVAVAMAERARTALRFAKIGVLSQRERHAFNLLQARLFARHHRRPLFWWKQPLVGVAASYLTETETERAYLEERAGLCFHFVEGAPASITSNIETGRGLVNGCDAELHSLTLAGDTTLDNCLANTVWNDQYGIWEVQIEPPLSVNAIPDVSDEARQTLLARGASLLDEELIVPVLVGKASSTYAPTSSWAARVGVPKELRINKHQIDLAFAVTDYKVEAQTVAPPTLATNQANPPCRCKARRSITSS